jgi:hypothetical protein
MTPIALRTAKPDSPNDASSGARASHAKLPGAPSPQSAVLSPFTRRPLARTGAGRSWVVGCLVSRPSSCRTRTAAAGTGRPFVDRLGPPASPWHRVGAMRVQRPEKLAASEVLPMPGKCLMKKSGQGLALEHARHQREGHRHLGAPRDPTRCTSRHRVRAEERAGRVHRRRRRSACYQQDGQDHAPEGDSQEERLTERQLHKRPTIRHRGGEAFLVRPSGRQAATVTAQPARTALMLYFHAKPVSSPSWPLFVLSNRQN